MIKLPKILGFILILMSIVFSVSYYIDFEISKEPKYSLLFASISSIGLIFVFINNISNEVNSSNKIENFILFKIIPAISFVLLIKCLYQLLNSTIDKGFEDNYRNLFFQFSSILLIIGIFIHALKNFIKKSI